MKANAPEKLYISDYGPEVRNYWHPKRLAVKDIEYVRNDAFIEKLECWMNEKFYQHAGEFDEGILGPFDKIEDAIENFRNYMKGSKV